MQLMSIASGSSGNCIYVGNDRTHVLIDAGISKKRIENGLNGIGLKGEELDAIFITHEHADHIQGLGVMARKYGIPMYGTAGTIKAILAAGKIGKVDETLFHPIVADEDFKIGDMAVHPLNISHDAAEPVAYVVKSGDKSAAVVTDLGNYNEYLVENLQNMDMLLLEANHDVKMLEVGVYPYPLKQRILSDRGHLSNECSGQFLCRLLHDKVKKIFLGHLSKENNYPQLAYETVRMEVTMGNTPYKGSDFPIEIANRDCPSELVVV